MTNLWISLEPHQHPAPHQAGTYGFVALSSAGVYYLRVGNTHMSCPQDWAARIHAEETLPRSAMHSRREKDQA